MDLMLLLMAGLGLAAVVGVLGDNDDDREEVPSGEERFGTEGDDALFAELGASGDDTLNGLGGDDTLGGGDRSHLFGGAGDDLLFGDGTSTAHGDDGDDELDGEDQATLYGGAGNDLLSGDDASALHGDDGNDRLDLYGTATGYGGAGDDTLTVSGYGEDAFAEVFGGAGDDVISLLGSGAATGGTGADLFRVVTPGAGQEYQILDYQRDEDRIAVSSLTPPDSVTITSNGTDSLVEVQHDGQVTSFSVLGVADLTAEDLWFDPSRYSTFNPDHLMQWQGGTEGDDAISMPDTPTAIFTGSGDDSVTGGDGGSEFVDLGAGNDSYVGGESFSWVDGGDGEDDITVHIVPGLDYPDAAPDGEATYGEQGNNTPAVQGGAGNDVIHITEPSPAVAPTDWLTGLEVFGGTGDDLITADAGGVTASSNGLALFGGAGSDTLIGEGNTLYDLTDTRDLPEADVAHITIAADHTWMNVATVRFDTADHVTLTIDPALSGPITTEFQPSYDLEYGQTAPAQTNLYVGDTLVAVLIDRTESEIDVLTDPRITILRA